MCKLAGAELPGIHCPDSLLKTDNAPPENYANSCEGMVWLKVTFPDNLP